MPFETSSSILKIHIRTNVAGIYKIEGDFLYDNKYYVYEVTGTCLTPETLIDVEKEITYATLFTKKYNNYFANGMLSGNRHSKEINL